MQPPRYAAQTPIPEVPYLPGINSRPADFQVTTSPTSEDWRKDMGYLHGIDLFNHACYWEAHEAWEHQWLHVAEGELVRTHLQGLIQASAALLKLVSSQPEPARTIWERGRTRLMTIAADAPEKIYRGIEIAPLITTLDALIDKGTAVFSAPAIILVGWT